jgi:hypothetical protein
MNSGGYSYFTRSPTARISFGYGFLPCDHWKGRPLSRALAIHRVSSACRRLHAQSGCFPETPRPLIHWRLRQASEGQVRTVSHCGAKTVTRMVGNPPGGVAQSSCWHYSPID